MHDGGKILTGLAVFLALALLPFWHNAVGGTAAAPQPKIVTQEKECVAPRETIRSTHMELLNSWRDTVVRKGSRTYVDARGRTVDMSLTKTCLSCHPNKKEFCDACHNYLAVSPYCWQCHVEKKESA
jgi:[DsrC]-trisulfide reductase subunit J